MFNFKKNIFLFSLVVFLFISALFLAVFDLTRIKTGQASLCSEEKCQEKEFTDTQYVSEKINCFNCRCEQEGKRLFAFFGTEAECEDFKIEEDRADCYAEHSLRGIQCGFINDTELKKQCRAGFPGNVSDYYLGSAGTLFHRKHLIIEGGRMHISGSDRFGEHRIMTGTNEPGDLQMIFRDRSGDVEFSHNLSVEDDLDINSPMGGIYFASKTEFDDKIYEVRDDYNLNLYDYPDSPFSPGGGGDDSGGGDGDFSGECPPGHEDYLPIYQEGMVNSYTDEDGGDAEVLYTTYKEIFNPYDPRLFYGDLTEPHPVPPDDDTLAMGYSHRMKAYMDAGYKFERIYRDEFRFYIPAGTNYVRFKTQGSQYIGIAARFGQTPQGEYDSYSIDTFPSVNSSLPSSLEGYKNQDVLVKGDQTVQVIDLNSEEPILDKGGWLYMDVIDLGEGIEIASISSLIYTKKQEYLNWYDNTTWDEYGDPACGTSGGTSGGGSGSCPPEHEDYIPLYEHGYEIRYCTGHEDDYDGAADKLGNYTGEMRDSYQGFFNPYDPKLICQMEEGCSEDLPLEGDFIYGNALWEQVYPGYNNFRVFVAPGTTDFGLELYPAQHDEIGVAVRFKKPVEGDYDTDSIDYHHSDIWTDQGHHDPLSLYEGEDILHKNHGGHITIGGTSQFPELEEGGWMYIKVLKFEDPGEPCKFYKFAYGPRINNEAYVDWYDNAEFNAEGNPGCYVQ